MLVEGISAICYSKATEGEKAPLNFTVVKQTIQIHEKATHLLLSPWLTAAAMGW